MFSHLQRQLVAVQDARAFVHQHGWIDGPTARWITAPLRGGKGGGSKLCALLEVPRSHGLRYDTRNDRYVMATQRALKLERARDWVAQWVRRWSTDLLSRAYARSLARDALAQQGTGYFVKQSRLTRFLRRFA